MVAATNSRRSLPAPRPQRSFRGDRSSAQYGHPTVAAAASVAAYVAQHALAVDGPLREYYLVGPQDASDERALRTGIGWPILQIA